MDPQTGKTIEYKIDGDIQYDPLSGDFILTWTGIDGTPKKLVYVPRSKLDAVIAASAEYDQGQNLYRYSYSASNLKSSQERLQSIYIEAKAPLQQAAAPDASWYSTEFTPFLKQHFDAVEGWTWSQTRQDRDGLAPGETVSGFQFVSSGLPAVVKCAVEGHAPRLESDEELPEEFEDALAAVAWKIPQGFTIGPEAIPKETMPIVLIQRLEGMLDAATSQGWVDSRSVSPDGKSLLEEARLALTHADTRRASKSLTNFLDLVRRRQATGLLSEGYSLLKLNLEYLLSRIK